MDSNSSDNVYYYSINQIARSFGISRATLLRLEECGLLIPAKKNEDTGYRFYDQSNIALLSAILKLQDIGLSKKEIRFILDNPFQAGKSIEEHLIRSQTLLRKLEELLCGVNRYENLSTRPIYAKSLSYFVYHGVMDYEPQNLRYFLTDTMLEFMNSGLPGNVNHTMNVVLDDADLKESIGQFDGKRHKVHASVPLLGNPKGNNIICYEDAEALTFMCHCDYRKSEPYFRKLWNEAINMGHKPKTPVFIATMPDMYLVEDKDMSNTPLRLMLMIKGTIHRQ